MTNVREKCCLCSIDLRKRFRTKPFLFESACTKDATCDLARDQVDETFVIRIER